MNKQEESGIFGKVLVWGALILASWFFYAGGDASAASGVGANVGGLPKSPTFNSVTAGQVTATNSAIGSESVTGDSNYVSPATTQYIKRSDTDGAIVLTGGSTLGGGGGVVVRGNTRSSLPGTVDIYSNGSFSTRFHSSGAVSIGTSAENGALNVAGSGAFSGALTAGGNSVATETSGTFSGNFTTACTTTPSGSYKWTKTGSVVVLTLTSAVSCTSDTTLFSLDDGSLPAAIRPASDVCAVAGPTRDNTGSVDKIGLVRIESDGGLNYTNGPANSCTVANWTSSGTKAIYPTIIIYSVI